MDFLPIPEDYVVKSIAEYYPVDNEGNGYHIGTDGKIIYPVVYIASTRGCIFSCHRKWVYLKTAKRHLEAGSADILGRRTVPGGDLYLIRTFHTIFHTVKKVKRRYFTGRSYTVDGSSLPICLGAIILTTFKGARPRGCIINHKANSWDNSLDNIEWMPYADNYLKENHDPQ
jgi:hypothetical protein